VARTIDGTSANQGGGRGALLAAPDTRFNATVLNRPCVPGARPVAHPLLFEGVGVRLWR
jgi:hypothetical protein